MLNRALVVSVFLLFVSLYLSTTGIALTSSVLLLGGAWAYRHELAELRRRPLFFPLIFLSSLVLLSIFLAPDYDFEKPLGKLRYYWLYWILILFFLKRPKTRVQITNWAVGIGIILGAMAILQSIFGFFPMRVLGLTDLAPVFESTDRFFHARGFVFHHVPFGFTCTLLYHWLLGTALGKGLRKTAMLHILSLLLCSVAVFLSFSRGAWLAFGVSNLVVALSVLKKKERFLALGFVAAAVIAVVTVPALYSRASAMRPDQNQDRLMLWRVSLKMFQDRPLLGQGFHSFADRRMKFATEDERATPNFPTDPHSMYLDMLGGTGILGFGAFLWFIIAAFLNYFIALKKDPPSELRGQIIGAIGAWVAFCVGGAFDSHNVITYTLCATIFYLALGQSAVWDASSARVDGGKELF